MTPYTSKKMKVVLPLSGLLIGIILLELSLQLFSLIKNYQGQEFEIKDDGKQIRILALGESTTTPYTLEGGDRSWPKQLEMLLRENFPQKDFRVINKGIEGTSSTFIVKNLPHYIEKWRPHLIIAMMGINDNLQIDYLHKESFFEKLILVRLINWYLSTMKLVPLKTASYEDAVELKKLLDKRFSLNGPLIPPPVEEWIKKNPDLKWYAYREITIIFFKYWWKIPLSVRDKEQVKQIFPIIRESVRINPLDTLSIRHLIYAGDDFNTKETRELLVYAFESGLRPDDTILSEIFIVNPHKNKRLAAYLERAGYYTSSHSPLDILRRNYQKMFKIAQAAGIDLAVMSYPTTKPEVYKALFAEEYPIKAKSFMEIIYKDFPPMSLKPPYDEIIFLDNSNFPFDNKEGLYIDRFVETGKGGFGHTSALGHARIARNVFNGLSNWLKKILHENSKGVLEDSQDK